MNEIMPRLINDLSLLLFDYAACHTLLRSVPIIKSFGFHEN